MMAQPTTPRTRAQLKRAELEHVRQLNAPVAPGPDGEDHGLDLGPAMQARGGSIERVGGRVMSSAQRKATPVYARRMPSETLFERMNEVSQLSDRQAKAGHRLWMLKRAAGIDQQITARYPVVHDAPHSDDGDETEVVETICPEGWEPRTYHRYVLRQLPAHVAGLLDRACDWSPDHQAGHPGVRWLGQFQFGLDRLALVFGIKE